MTDLLADLAPIDAFPTVDEMHAFAHRLAVDHPDVVEVSEIGRSRAGDVIELVSIATPDAELDVLVVGQPHPNEPMGMATITAMCSALLADRQALAQTRARWHFVPVADPDGTRLNEGWFAGPFTREHYARNFFRPGAEAQVEWTFPFAAEGFAADSPMPETQALMTAIDRVKPAVMASLHNAELGGAYFYASGGDASYYAMLGEICARHDVPLHLGEPEIPICSVLAPAVFSVPTADEIHAMAVAFGIPPGSILAGANSYDWARRHGDVAALVIELPYWRDDQASDTTPASGGLTRREVVIEALDLEAVSMAQLSEIHDRVAPLPPSLLADGFVSLLGLVDGGMSEARRQQALSDPDYDRPPTVAEVFSARDEVDILRLRLAGMLLRAMPAGTAEAAELDELLTTWCAEAAAGSKASVIPIASLVRVQAEAILALVALHV